MGYCVGGFEWVELDWQRDFYRRVIYRGIGKVVRAHLTEIRRWPGSGPSFKTVGLSVPLWSVYLLAAAVGVAALSMVYLVDPRNPGVYPICPFFGLTGYHCPGCGTLRALHQLLHGNVTAALGYNVYSMLALPLVGYFLAAAGLRAYRLPAPPRLTIPAPFIWALLAAILAFWLARNLPIQPFMVLAP